MTRLVYAMRCLGCSRRLHASNQEALQRQWARHVRNCNALKRHLVPLGRLPTSTSAGPTSSGGGPAGHGPEEPVADATGNPSSSLEAPP